MRTFGGEGELGGVVRTIVDDDRPLGACDRGLNGCLSFHAVHKGGQALCPKPARMQTSAASILKTAASS